ncbi:MAG: hypothetical protein K8L97_13700 [Anaerolineae bacterium]|nr:hypothetical protein [Anaerolineae bacterium]
MRLFIPFVLLIILAACQPAAPQGELPTLAVLPSLEPSAEASAEPTLTETPEDTPIPTETSIPSLTPTATNTPPPSFTPRPTRTAIATIEPTIAANASATAAVIEAPIFSTFTPAPPGSTGPLGGTPAQLADVTITQGQFQEEVSLRLPNYPTIDRAIVDFVPGGINVELTASGGEAFITGRVFVSIILTGDFATISLGEITVNAPEPPEAYVEVVTGDFFFMMVESLDAILKQRVGEEQDLESIVVTDTAMEVTLRVPQ